MRINCECQLNVESSVTFVPFISLYSFLVRSASVSHMYCNFHLTSEETVVFSAFFKMNFVSPFELHISIYFAISMIWSPENNQKRKQEILYI